MWTGFLTQTWGDIQEAYHRREKHDQAYTGQRWTTHLVHSIWDCALSLWKQRVKRVHEKDQPTPPHRQAVLQQVTEFYPTILRIPNVLGGLLNLELPKLLEKPTKYLTRWLRIAMRIPLNEKVNTLRRKGIGQDIRKYLPMASKPPDQIQPHSTHPYPTT